MSTRTVTYRLVVGATAAAILVVLGALLTTLTTLSDITCFAPVAFSIGMTATLIVLDHSRAHRSKEGAS